MGQFKDLTEQKFNRLTVKYKYGKDKHGNILWYCECDCGGNNIVRTKELKNGAIKSCGCLSVEQAQKLKIINTKYDKCTIEGCENKHYGNGFCESHNREFNKYGKIRNEEEKKEARKKPKESKIQYCEICNDTYKTFYNKETGMVLCQKHIAQFKRHRKFLERTRFDGNEFIVNGYTTEIVLYNILGEVIAKAIINTNQLENVKSYKWYLNSSGYAETNLGDNKKITLHRFLMNPPDDIEVDHKNRRRLDCRLSNLRLCTKTENNRNVSVKKHSKSQIRGIYQDSYNKWIAYININKKKIHLGYFENLEDAIKAREEAELKYYGEFAPCYWKEEKSNE